jgi:hypothetical protein
LGLAWGFRVKDRIKARFGSLSSARTWPSISMSTTLKAAGSTLRSTAASAPSTSRLSRPTLPCSPAAAMSLESGAHLVRGRLRSRGRGR